MKRDLLYWWQLNAVCGLVRKARSAKTPPDEREEARELLTDIVEQKVYRAWTMAQANLEPGSPYFEK